MNSEPSRLILIQFELLILELSILAMEMDGKLAKMKLQPVEDTKAVEHTKEDELMSMKKEGE